MSVAVVAMKATVPFKIKELGGDFGAVGLLFLWTSAWYVASGLGLGWVSHHFGPRRVVLATLALCAAVTLVMPATTALGQLYVLTTVYFMSECLFWAAMEHASTGLHSHLSLVQSTAIFCVAFSVGNAVGLLISGTLQGQTMTIPFLVSVALTLVVGALAWWTVSPQAGFQRSTSADVAAFPDDACRRVRRSLLASRTGLVGVYGTYALVMLFLPRYLWETHGYAKPLAGALTSLTLTAMAATFAAHGWFAGWQHRLVFVRVCPFAAAAGLWVAGMTAQPVGIAAGAIVVGMAAATAYTHNLFYSLEEPGRRARRAGIHEAIVGVAFMVPPALSGLATRWTNDLRSIFWVGAALAVIFGLAQNLVLLRRRAATP
jgi:MFS family permease